jgi:hypothetical protein
MRNSRDFDHIDPVMDIAARSFPARLAMKTVQAVVNDARVVAV